MSLDQQIIEKKLKSPIRVRVFREIDSTNNEAKRRADKDHTAATLYAADAQTAGRGRRGHNFYSPKESGLYFTLALPFIGFAADVQSVTCAAAVAVCEAIAEFSDKQPLIKWVNDVYIDGKKVAGILTELVTDEKNTPLSVLIGIGVNLTTAVFPQDFADKAAGVGDIDANLLCAAIVDRLYQMYEQWNFNSNSELNGDYYSMLEKYKRLNFCLGREVTYTDKEGAHSALAVDIARDGSLIVKENGIEKRLHSGEISVRT